MNKMRKIRKQYPFAPVSIFFFISRFPFVLFFLEWRKRSAGRLVGERLTSPLTETRGRKKFSIEVSFFLSCCGVLAVVPAKKKNVGENAGPKS